MPGLRSLTLLLERLGLLSRPPLLRRPRRHRVILVRVFGTSVGDRIGPDQRAARQATHVTSRTHGTASVKLESRRRKRQRPRQPQLRRQPPHQPPSRPRALSRNQLLSQRQPRVHLAHGKRRLVVVRCRVVFMSVGVVWMEPLAKFVAHVKAKRRHQRLLLRSLQQRRPPANRQAAKTGVLATPSRGRRSASGMDVRGVRSAVCGGFGATPLHHQPSWSRRATFP